MVLNNHNNEISSFRDMNISLEVIIATTKERIRDSKINKIL